MTLEPLVEIPETLFFSYIDANNFTYGFDIFSLIIVLSKKYKIVNPYNRENIENAVIRKIYTMYNIIRILYKIEFCENLSAINHNSVNIAMTPIRNTQHIQNTYNSRVNLHRRFTSESDDEPASLPTDRPSQRIGDITVMNNGPSQNSVIITRDPMNVIVDTMEINLSHLPFRLNTELEELRQRMSIIQTKPANIRIQELFIEIDLMGNYTQSSWVSSLNRHGYIRFIHYLNDIWNYRLEITPIMRRKICQLQDPFMGIPVGARITTYTDEQIELSCLQIMEHLAYTGVDQEFRKLGILYILTALTMVSIPARTAIPWLYDSMVY